MRLTRLPVWSVFLITTVARIAAAQQDALRWTRILPPGRGAFEDAWRTDRWPMGAHPFARPDGSLLMVGISTVWQSPDGLRWDRATAAAPWTRRAGNRSVVFRGALWLFGGKGKEEDGESGYASDVWRLHREPR